MRHFGLYVVHSLLLLTTTMSSASSLPSPAERENLSVLFIGFVAATVLYGLTFFRMCLSHITFFSQS